MSTKISFFKVLSNRKIEKINDVNYAGTNNVDKFHFFFEDSEWDGLNKTLEVFVGDEMQGFPIVNDEAEVGRSVYQPGIIYIRIHGIDGATDKKSLKFPIPINAEECDAGDPANTPTESEWNAFITEINAKLSQAVITKEECAAILAEVLVHRDVVEDDKDDVEQLKADVQNLKRIIEQEIEEAEGVLDTYNANYLQKLAAFNENYNTKKQIIDDEISDFESDYTQKVANFDSNATQKTTEYDSNATTKKNNFDSNATTKTNAYNTNHTNKLKAYNDNHDEKMEAYNTNDTQKTTDFNNNYDTKLAAINSAGSTQVGNVNTAGSTQVSAVNSAGATQVSAVETAGTTQTNAVNQAGQQKIDEINSNQTVQQVNNHESRLRVLEKKDGRCYSIVRKITNNSSPNWTREDDAVGLVANAKIGTTEAVQNDFDNIYPWSDIKDCNVDANGEPTHYIGESGFDPTAEVYVHIPKHWIKRFQYTKEELNGNNEIELVGYEKISIYDYAAQGAIEIKEYFIGKYDTAYEGTVPVSKTGLYPANSTTRATHRTRARTKGTNFGLLDWRCFDIRFLYLVEYANYNCEAMLGHGNISYARGAAILDESNTNRIILDTVPNGFYIGKSVSIGTDYGNYSVARDREITAIEDYSYGNVTDKKAITFDGEAVNITTGNYIWLSGQKSGQLDSFGNTSGCLVNDNYHCVTYRGIENVWGNVYQHLDGLNIRDKQSYICYDPSEYTNDKFTSPYVELGYANATGSDSYIKEVGYDENNPLIAMPTDTGGSSSTYLCDAYWSSDGDRILLVGGYASSLGSKYGLFASYCFNASSSSSWPTRGSPSYSYQLKRGTGGGQPPENISNIQHSYFYFSNTI